MVRSEMLMVEDTATGFIFHLMSPAQFEHYWPEISRMMDSIPHTWSDHYTKDYFQHGAESGQLQFWSGGSRELALCVVVTQIANYPACRALQVLWAAGDGVLSDALRVGEVALEQFAMEQDCDWIEVISGRSGWEKVLPAFGFKKSSSMMSRRVAKPPQRRN